MPRSKPKSNRKSDAQGDCLYTPYYGIEPILPYIPADLVVWEPAVGKGHLESVLRNHGNAVISGDIETGQNYFDDRCIPETYDIQITNPPYSIKADWLARAYELGKPFALLLPADTLFRADCQRSFIKHGYQMLLPDKRIDYKTVAKEWSGDAQFTSAWFCWQLEGLESGVNFVKLNKPSKGYVRSATDEMMRYPHITQMTISMFDGAL